MLNWHRWALTLTLAFATGFIEDLQEPKQNFQEAMRHGLQDLLPCIVALKMTLDKEPEKAVEAEPVK